MIQDLINTVENTFFEKAIIWSYFNMISVCTSKPENSNSNLEESAFALLFQFVHHCEKAIKINYIRTRQCHEDLCWRN